MSRTARERTASTHGMLDPTTATLDEVSAAFPPGAIVQFRPYAGRNPWYLGVIAPSPPQKFDGLWCIRLTRMEHSYGRGKVGAAPVRGVTVISPPTATSR